MTVEREIKLCSCTNQDFGFDPRINDRVVQIPDCRQRMLYTDFDGRTQNVEGTARQVARRLRREGYMVMVSREASL